MDSLSYSIFICLVVPMVLMLIPIEKQSKKVVLGIIIGMFCCLFISEVNGLMYNLTNTTYVYFTTNVTPINEELVKAFPILMFVMLYPDNDRKSIYTFAFSVGVGFAMLENAIIIVQNISSVNIFFALIRGFASGEMHSICAVTVSYFIAYMHENNRMFRLGSICALNLAIVYHSVYNLLVQASYTYVNYIGFFMPIVTYLLINAFFFKTIVFKRLRLLKGKQTND